MPSVHRQTGKPNWFCAYCTWDAERQQWKRRFKSTGTTNKKEALQICQTWDKAARLGRQGRLTPDKARDVIASGVADVFVMANRDVLQSGTIKDWCNSWLDTKLVESEPTTVTRYRGIVSRFITHLGIKAERDVATLTAAEIVRFRDALAKTLSRNSANLAVKTLRVCLGAALRQGLMTSNPASLVTKLKQNKEASRRPFTLSEIQRVMNAAEGSEWYGMTLLGLYCGGRLSDLANLTWGSLDLEKEVLAFTARKTGQRLHVPLAQPVISHFSSLPSSDDLSSPIFRRLSTKSASKLSEGFRKILASAGLAAAPKKHSTGKGRHAARDVSELSFHSLRHSFVSILKSTGANEAVAMALAGHETKAISQHYTALDEETLRAAIAKLPDVTGAKKSSK